MAALFFQAHGASRMRTCTIQNFNKNKQKQNTFKQNYSEERVAWKKISTNIFESGISGEKIIKRLTGESWKQFEFEPCYTCEKTSQLSSSPGCYTPLWLCALAGVYSRGKLPQFSLFCLFLYICRQNM